MSTYEELPAWQVFGPNGQEVAALIEQAKQVTPSEAKALAIAWAAGRNPDRDAERNAAWLLAADDAVWESAEAAVWDACQRPAGDPDMDAAEDAAWDAAWDAVWYAAWDAAVALIVHGLITDEQYQTFAGPWLSVMGEEAVTA